ncbi:NAD(P)-dependent alcohol dehydrogenase [Poritiphilus flavus]|uniref:Zinc-binding dehydrogenase n=1 Tax=Poritiphilus flavus TaxID=2697053 RepID=A0A6L9EC31_9FLAO|nr:NAD(P)-dependent alcohol dehydrogenase [Poritiphilus flavus]NAS12203.1 zinc-binding dehydrogenase [Poritiphilus flavus]
MKAIVCTKYGSPDVLQLQEVAIPVPKDNEVLIRIHAAAVTTAGLIGRKGTPFFTRIFSGLTKPRNNILGMELSGEIKAAGRKVSQFKKGDQVFGLTGTGLGSNAEYICLSEDAALVKKPKDLTYEESAALIEGGLTALNFLRNKARIQSGQRVLIVGASGSVGTASVQLAKYFGAEVTAVCSKGNAGMVRSLGADKVIDYKAEDFTQSGHTYDIIFDTLGKHSFPACQNSLTSDGIFLDAAGLSTVFHMLWTSIFSRKKAILTATYVRSAKKIKPDLLYLKELIEREVIKPVIDRHYPLEKTAEAHQYVETGRKKGNVILSIVPSAVEFQN